MMKVDDQVVATYLGDGVYAAFDGMQVIVTTHNGLTTTNTVYLDREVADALVQFIRKHSEEGDG